METVVDCCYRELRLKCDRAPRSTLKRIDKFRLTLCFHPYSLKTLIALIALNGLSVNDKPV